MKKHTLKLNTWTESRNQDQVQDVCPWDNTSDYSESKPV